MIKIAYVSPNGEVHSIVEPRDDFGWVDGSMVGSDMIKILPYAVDNATVLNSYWTGTEFLPKPTRPGSYYFWEAGAWVLDSTALRAELKRMRNLLLRAYDWTQLGDVTLTAQQIQACRSYRQALRDLPAQYPNVTTIEEVIWPDPPVL